MRAKCLLLFTLALICFLSTPAACQEKLSDSQVERIDEIIKRAMSTQQIPGLGVAIAIDANVVWMKAYGFADLENSAPTTTDTKFRTASIGKPMTATAVMKLVEDGSLKLNDRIQDHLPEFPIKKWPVTLQDLLTHQSGLRAYRENEVANSVHYGNIFDALGVFKEDALLFEPGTEYSYSSFNYNVLGCIVERAARADFMTLMRRSVFDPAGMSNTMVDDVYSIVRNRARGYRFNKDIHRIENAALHDMSDRIPAGGFLSTPEDLVKFSIAFYSGKLVSQESVSKMIACPALKNGKLSLYGLGWGLYEPEDKFRGFTEIFHGGQSPGVSSMLVLLLSPDRKMAIAMMTNLEGMQGRGEICEQIAEIVLSQGRK